MALDTWEPVTVTGKLAYQGITFTGTGTATPRFTVAGERASKTVVLPNPVTFTIADGLFIVQLLPSQDPDIDPEGAFTYQFVISPTTGPRKTITFDLPVNASDVATGINVYDYMLAAAEAQTGELLVTDARMILLESRMDDLEGAGYVTAEALDAYATTAALAALTAADVGADPAGTAAAAVNGLDIPSTPGDIGAATAAQGAKADTAVQPARNLAAGAGLTGGGDLSANRTFAVQFGTSAGTVAQGNDARITGAAQTTDLAAVATSGSYTDLADTPTVPEPYTDADAQAALADDLAAKLDVTTAGATYAALADDETITGTWDFNVAPTILGEPIGTEGPQGPAGIVWRGAYDNGTTYGVNDAVTAFGSSYVALAGTTGVSPVDGESSATWLLIAQKGDDGDSGGGGAEAAGMGPAASLMGLVSVAYDPILANGSVESQAGIVQGVKLYLAAGDVATGVTFGIQTAGITVGAGSAIGLYAPDGTLLAQTADLSAPFMTSATPIEADFTTPYTATTSGAHYVGILVTSASDIPNFRGISGGNSDLLNMRHGSLNPRFLQLGISGQTSLPAEAVPSTAQSNRAIWVGLY